MEDYELKVLRYINCCAGHKGKLVPTSIIAKRFDSSVTIILEVLMEKEYISCELVSNSDSFISYANLPSMDNWKITDKGKCFLYDNRLHMVLSARERIIFALIGGAIGILGSFFGGIATNAADYVWQAIITM